MNLLYVEFSDFYVNQSLAGQTVAMLPRLKTTPPHQNVFVKRIFGYLLRAPLKVDTYNYVPTSITASLAR
jgi:hypothetical protein